MDLTTLRVAGAYEDSALARKGWGPDRRVARQVRVLQATNPLGLPLYVRPHPGGAAELACIGMALERLAQLLPPGLLVCADSALGHVKNLCAADRAGLRFVVPLRDASGFAERFLAEVGHDGLHRLDYRSRRERHLPPARRARYRGALRPFGVTDPDTAASHTFRVAYIWSSDLRYADRATGGRCVGGMRGCRRFRQRARAVAGQRWAGPDRIEKVVG